MDNRDDVGNTRHTKAVRLSGRQMAIRCVYLILITACAVECDASDAYPSYAFLSKIGSDGLTETVVQKVARELEKDRLAQQFGPQRQTAVHAVAARLVARRRFEAKVDDFKRIVDKAELPPLSILPPRYMSTDRLLAVGRRYADDRMADVIVDHWMRQGQVSRLELDLWDALVRDNPDRVPRSMPMLVNSARLAAGRVTEEVHRGPYRLVDQLAEQYAVRIQSHESVEEAVQQAVRKLIDDAGLIPSTELVLYARIKLQPRVRHSRGAAAQESLIPLSLLSRAWRYPCDWDSRGRDHLRLAADLLYQSGTPVESLNAADLGPFLVFVIGLPARERLELERTFQQEKALLGAEKVVKELVKNNESLKQGVEDMRLALAQADGFHGDMGTDASSRWVARMGEELRDDLRRRSLKTQPSSTGHAKLLLEEASELLSQTLVSIWGDLVREQIRARETRIVKLNAADLGDMKKFRSFSDWPLREQVRITLGESLRREGWSQDCMDNYFLSLALDARVEQLADLVMRILHD